MLRQEVNRGDRIDRLIKEMGATGLQRHEEQPDTPDMREWKGEGVAVARLHVEVLGQRQEAEAAAWLEAKRASEEEQLSGGPVDTAAGATDTSPRGTGTRFWPRPGNRSRTRLRAKVSGDMAFACLTQYGKFTYKGTPNDDIAKFTVVLSKKDDGSWIQVHAHRSTGQDPE